MLWHRSYGSIRLTSTLLWPTLQQDCTPIAREWGTADSKSPQSPLDSANRTCQFVSIEDWNKFVYLDSSNCQISSIYIEIKDSWNVLEKWKSNKLAMLLLFIDVISLCFFDFSALLKRFSPIHALPHLFLKFFLVAGFKIDLLLKRLIYDGFQFLLLLRLKFDWLLMSKEISLHIFLRLHPLVKIINFHFIPKQYLF